MTRLSLPRFRPPLLLLFLSFLRLASGAYTCVDNLRHPSRMRSGDLIRKGEQLCHGYAKLIVSFSTCDVFVFSGMRRMFGASHSEYAMCRGRDWYLGLEDDGDLVLRADRSVVWKLSEDAETGPNFKAGFRPTLFLKDNGNVVIKSDNFDLIWALDPDDTDTLVEPPSSAPTDFDFNCVRAPLQIGDRLQAGESLCSDDRKYALTMEKDRARISLLDMNLRTATYASPDFGTTAGGNHYGELMNNGNFVLFSGSGREIWRTNSLGPDAKSGISMEVTSWNGGTVTISDRNRKVLWKKDKGSGKLFCNDSPFRENFEEAKSCQNMVRLKNSYCSLTIPAVGMTYAQLCPQTCDRCGSPRDVPPDESFCARIDRSACSVHYRQCPSRCAFLIGDDAHNFAYLGDPDRDCVNWVRAKPQLRCGIFVIETGLPVFSMCPRSCRGVTPVYGECPTNVVKCDETASPSARPSGKTQRPSAHPSKTPSVSPTRRPTPAPVDATKKPSASPTEIPTAPPTKKPTATPAAGPTEPPIPQPTDRPSPAPSDDPTASPVQTPTTNPPTPSTTEGPTPSPTPKGSTGEPTFGGTEQPTERVTRSFAPTQSPTWDVNERTPSTTPSARPSCGEGTCPPTPYPTFRPTSE